MAHGGPAAPDVRARAAAAAGVLQRWYEPATGRWRTAGWWNCANAVTALARWMRVTGDDTHAAALDTTFRRARLRHPGFINGYYDDNGWWALAWLDAHDLTGEARYLQAAQRIFAQLTTGWDETCGGGLWWNRRREYKNAITAELFAVTAARLHQAGPGRGPYLDWALRTWRWLDASGMIGARGLVHDGLRPDCTSNGGITWTYNQGVILGGLAALAASTGDEAYLDRADVIAGGALAHLTVPGAAGPGILTEPREAATKAGDRDRPQFKGIFTRYLADLHAHRPRPAYQDFLRANAASLCAHAVSARGEYGLHWAGPFDRADAVRQTAGLDLLTAAVRATGPAA